MVLEDTIQDLKVRVEKLEQNKKENEEMFQRLSGMKVAKEKEKEDKKTSELQNIVAMYEDGLDSNKIERVWSNIPLIIEYSVQFVEKFFGLIMKIMGLSFSEKSEKSSFKLNLCIDLISELFEISPDQMDFITNLINTFVKLLCNNDKYDEAKGKETLKRHNKKNGSVRKLGKFLTNFSKK